MGMAWVGVCSGRAYTEITEDAKSTEKTGDEVRFIAQKACDAKPYLAARTPLGTTSWVNSDDCAAIPPLRGPTRQNATRKRKSGRSGRDDRVEFGERRGPLRSSSGGRRNDKLG